MVVGNDSCKTGEIDWVGMNERKNDDGGGDIDNFSICLIDDL